MSDLQHAEVHPVSATSGLHKSRWEFGGVFLHRWVRYSQQRRVDMLMDAVTTWQQAEAIRQYCDAMERTGAAIDWLEWARTYADELSPPESPPNIPASFTPTNPEELRPYLEGWSPYPPNRR